MISKSKFHPNYQLLSPQPEPTFHKLSFLQETMIELAVLLSDQSEQRVSSRDNRLAGRGTSRRC